MSHTHAELRTYYLYKECLEKIYNNNPAVFFPFGKPDYWAPAKGSDHPCVYLEFIHDDHTCVLDVLYSKEGYILQFFIRDLEDSKKDLDEINNHAGLSMKLEETPRYQLVSSGYKTMSEVKKRILEICENLKGLFVSE
jgi:hypothetical protein